MLLQALRSSEELSDFWMRSGPPVKLERKTGVLCLKAVDEKMIYNFSPKDPSSQRKVACSSKSLQNFNAFKRINNELFYVTLETECQ
jgi:hypothetical protein